MRHFKKVGRTRHEPILESEEHEFGARPALNALTQSSEEAGRDIEVRRASEPITPSTGSLFPELSEPPKPPRHQSTSGSSFYGFGAQLTRKNNNKEILSQQDPLGLTLVRDCEQPTADLIFVHGLGGTSKKTWSYERDVHNFWPPWLGSEVGLSNTRIFTFGYNANFAQQSTNLSILDFAKDLLFQAQTYQHPNREDHARIGDQPMIFVVHSMGGLVVKKAYVIGKTDDQYNSMMAQTYGIVFLGTPHRGSGFSQTLNNILRAAPNAGAKVYLNELEKGSTTLQDINEQFRNVCGELTLVSFHETLKTSIGPTKVLIVEKESAILGYPGEISAPLHADHHGMSKFRNREDGNYRDVRNILRLFVRKIKELRNTDHSALEQVASVPTVTIDRILGISGLGSDLDTFRQRIIEGSCHWIFQKQSFRDWIEDSDNTSSIFWLTGPPAVGKTTLSSFIIDYLNRGFVLGTCQYHFFQTEHHETRTISYFLRSLAFQIAQKHETFRAMLISSHQENCVLFGLQKYQVIWEKIFEGILFRLHLSEPLFWVLDGLDEAEMPATLSSLITKINSVTSIRVLLVSRHTKDLSTALSIDNRPICHEEIQIGDTADDIHDYVVAVIRQNLPDNEDRDMVIDNVIAKANGSFLWVKLALERIKDSWHTAEDIQRALDETPEGMEFMYERMIEIVANQKPDRIRSMAVDILTWASCAFRPLDVEELAVALKPKFGNFINLEVTISQICGNFIVIKKSKVSLIHQTARKFLLANNPDLPISIDSRKGHEHIALTCLNFLSDPKWKTRLSTAQVTDTITQTKNSPISLEEPLSDSFFWYATTHWAYHVSCSPAVDESEKLQSAVFDFLERFSLVWINAVASSGNLRILTRSAQYLKAYVKRKAHHISELPPTGFKSNRDEELQQWAIDFIRVVGRFGGYLAENPPSIYKHVVPFCPADSMLSRRFGHLSRATISVKGISSGRWDDCLARLTMGGDETASKVICKDNYFITLLGGTGTLVIWHSETCGEARRLYHKEYVTSIKASKISCLVASAGIKTIKVWDIITGQETFSMPKTNQSRVMSLAFTSNDTELLVAYDDCTVQCTSLRTAAEKWTFRAEDPLEKEHSCPRLMSFSQDAKRVAIAYRGRPVFVWKIGQHRQRPQRCIRKEDTFKKEGDVWNAPEVVLWQPDSSNVIILYQDTKLVDWNVDDDTQAEHSHIGAREMVVSSDGNLLLTSNNNGTLSVWSTGSFRLLYQLEYDEFVRDIAFSPDAQRFYDVRGTLCNVWEPDALIRSDDSNREDSSTHDTLFSGPVVSSDDNSRVQISALICGEKDLYYCVGNEDGFVVIHEMETAQKLRNLYRHSPTVSIVEIAWSNSQRYIASVDDSGRVMAKRLEKPTLAAPKKWAVFPLLDQRLGTTVTQLLFSTSEEYLLVCSGSLDRIWSTKTKMKLFQVERSGGIPRRWVQHPTEPHLLICIQGNERSLYKWDTLQKVIDTAISPLFPDHVDEETFKLGQLQLKDSLAAKNPASSSWTNPERVLILQDRYLILEFSSRRGFSASATPSASRRLEMIDLQSPTLECRDLSLLVKNVNRLVGIFQGRLVFLDHQYWLCAWEHEDDESVYKRHFFLPKDWLSPGALRLFVLNQYGTLLCPKNGEVAIVRSGIRI